MVHRPTRPLQKIQIRDYQNADKTPRGQNEKDCCPICSDRCEFIKYGTYCRNVIDHDGVLARIQIQRYQCKRTMKTFSILPETIVPYRLYSIPLLNLLWKILITFAKKSQHQLMEMIGEQIPNILKTCIAYAQLKEAGSILESAMERMTTLTGQVFASLPDFFNYGQTYEYQGRRGFLAIQESVYRQQKIWFLFGTPSQCR